jgi:hypothetical protein
MATTKITSPDLFDLGSLDTALKLPSGTTAERPTSPSTGEWRYNTTTNLVEFYDGGEWRDLQSEDIPAVPSENFNTVLYSGNGSSPGDTQSITGVGFQPDLVWLKNRTLSGTSQYLVDSTRGQGTNVMKTIYSNKNIAEETAVTTGTNLEYGIIQSINSNGFTVAYGNLGGNETNSTGNNFVAWCFKANGGNTSSNTDGSITSTVQANTKAGFSIVKYTGNGTSGATIGHGLSAAPDMIIIKNLDDTDKWAVYHSAVGATKFLSLNETAAATTSSFYWNDTAPTSTVFTLGSTSPVNSPNTEDYIAYCFAEKAGYSKFGSYTGNGTTQSINTGFEPAFLMLKSSSQTGDWFIFDNKRSPSNPRNNRIKANLADAESTSSNQVNFLTNGFYFGSTAFNDNGRTFIYMAFASDPSAAPVLADSFHINLYTGTQATLSIDSLGFKPGLVWLKNRVINGYNHFLYDIVRGPGNAINSNLTVAEYSLTGVSSFDDDGFTLGSNYEANRSGDPYVDWAWKANSIPTINTDGTIQSVVSANQAAGFSIVKYTTTTNARVGHGLSQAPQIVLQKTLSSTNSFFFANNLVSGTNDWEYMELANTTAQTTNWTYWDGVEAPNATTFKDGWPNNTEMITYCFHSVDGYSKFGTYTGNGTTNAITGFGFQPDWILARRIDAADNWAIINSVTNTYLLANLSDAEATYNWFAFTSDGFTLSTSTLNASGGTYIYMAIKENPTQYPIASGEMGYLVVAGGGGGGKNKSGGGGAGGLRTSYGLTSGGGASAESNITLAAGTYTITIGSGGAGSSTNEVKGSNGVDSSISATSLTTITSIGGGGGGTYLNAQPGENGGSGGGAAGGDGTGSGGAAIGGTATANQGFDGGDGYIVGGGGSGAGGGGASQAGQDGYPDGTLGKGGDGGDGLSVAITGRLTAYAGGGGGACHNSLSFSAPGGTGGGGAGGGSTQGADATVNTGSGGGGGWTSGGLGGGDGASGLVILRMNTSDYSGTTTGSPTVTTEGSETILTYTGSGTYVHS